jgi:hypothetical protein
MNEQIKNWEKICDSIVNELLDENTQCYIQMKGYKEDIKDYLIGKLE